MSKFGDKFLNLLRLNDDEYDDYDDYDDYDYYDDEPKKSYKKSQKEDYSYDDEPVAPAKTTETQKAAATKTNPKVTAPRNSKVVPMRTGRNNMEVCVIKPANVDDAREITDTLLSGRAVILNLEGLHVDIAQRIIDFTSGSCYSINGNLQKVSSYIFIITPESVEISGDFQELLGGGFDVANFKQQ